jgi:hypothetical protein
LERPRGLPSAVRERFWEPALRFNSRRTRFHRVLPLASLTMDAPLPVGGPSSPEVLGAANNMSVSPLPRNPLEIVIQVRVYTMRLLRGFPERPRELPELFTPKYSPTYGVHMDV